MLLHEEGVLPFLHKVPHKKTGLCASIIHQKERSLVAKLGAALLFPTAFFEEQAKKLQSVKVVYGTGFFLSTNKEVIFALAHQALRNEQKFCLNLSSTFLIDDFQTEINTLLPFCDYVFGNEDEWTHFANKNKLLAEEGSNSTEYFMEVLK
mmetsp:Transcript_23561/g.18017  ORF Transcript_23561/g.18017 Transcript_23561/m.18017 type:complete len:151 (+) Transcript_23561:318-770(+)